MKVIISDIARKQLKKMDKGIAKKIIAYLSEIEKLENPRSRGKELASNLSGLWRYRVENYRIICTIEDDKVIITVVKIGHRKNIYKL
ncbi:MAG TPA: type II toxin-antitoxin system RelE/ParE family toxin [Treponemataceae bacterium]|nr:type II toxin-antitoxin system RelE/ParE family toxin [Treponemataceae bacterium]